MNLGSLLSKKWFSEFNKTFFGDIPAAKYIGDNSVVQIASGVNHHIDFPTKKYDTHNAVTVGAGTWKFKAPYSGVYSITGFTRFADEGSWDSPTQYTYIIARVGGVIRDYLRIKEQHAAYDAYSETPFSGELDLAAGEELTFEIFQSSGDLKSLATTPEQLWIAIHMVTRL